MCSLVSSVRNERESTIRSGNQFGNVEILLKKDPSFWWTLLSLYPLERTPYPLPAPIYLCVAALVLDLFALFVYPVSTLASWPPFPLPCYLQDGMVFNNSQLMKTF